MLYTEGDDDKKDDLDEIKLMPDLIEGNNLNCSVTFLVRVLNK